MADRKVTVWNNAGYQEILRTKVNDEDPGDRLVVDGGEGTTFVTDIGFFGANPRKKYESTGQTLSQVIENMRLALNAFNLTNITGDSNYVDDLNELQDYLNNPIDVNGTFPIVVTESNNAYTVDLILSIVGDDPINVTPTFAESGVRTINEGTATSTAAADNYTNVPTSNASAGDNALTINFTVNADNTITNVVPVNPGSGYIVGSTFQIASGHGGSTEMTVSAIGVNSYAISVDVATTTSTGVVSVGNGLSVTSEGVLSADTASDSGAGIIEIATLAEIITGTDNTKAISPDGLSGALNEEGAVIGDDTDRSDDGYTIDCGVYYTDP